jgi:hypothetical protein
MLKIVNDDFLKDDFLKEEGLYEDCSAAAIKRALARQLAEQMKRLSG